MATRLGIKRPRYNAWEQGISKPRADILNKLAEIFDVSTDYLLGLDDARRIVHGSFEVDLNPPEWASSKDKRDFKKMLEEDEPVMFDGVPISDEDKEKIKRVIQAMFWDAKEKNKKNYGRKKNKNTDE